MMKAFPAFDEDAIFVDEPDSTEMPIGSYHHCLSCERTYPRGWQRLVKSAQFSEAQHSGEAIASLREAGRAVDPLANERYIRCKK